MRLSSVQVQQIQSYFASQSDIVAVYLYGSFSSKQTHRQSDLDFGVLFDLPPKDHYRLGEIILGLAKLDLPTTDLDVRDINLDQSPLYLRNVTRGKIIYCRDESKRVSFEVSVMNRFYDTERLRNLKTYYTRKRLKEGLYGY